MDVFMLFILEYAPGVNTWKEKKMKVLISLALLNFFFISNLAAQVFTPDLGDKIYWDANTEPDVDEYRMYRGTTPCIDPTPTPGTCPTFAQVAVIPQAVDPINWTELGPIIFIQDYYYRVLAHNTSDLVSLFSNELNVRWFNPNAPSPPGRLRGTEIDANMWLDWDEPDPQEHVVAYNIWKSMHEELQGARIGTVSETRRYRDNIPGHNGPRYYRVTAVNDRKIESNPAGPVVYVGRSQ